MSRSSTRPSSRPSSLLRALTGLVGFGRLGACLGAWLAIALASGPASARLFMSALVADEPRLFRVAEDGTLEDVTVAPRRAFDLETDIEGRLIAVARSEPLPGHAVYRWDIESGTEELLTGVSYALSHVAPTLDGGVVIGDGALGVRFLATDGTSRWLIEDEEGYVPDHSLQNRHQGVQVDHWSQRGVVVHALQRPFRWLREPTVLRAIALDDGAARSEMLLPLEAHFQALARGSLVIPEYAAPNSDHTMIVDVGTGAVEVVADTLDAPTVWDITVGNDGTVYRVAEQERIELWEAASRSWIPWLEPPVDAVWSIAPTESLLDRELDCPRDNHGYYVSCVARRTQALVKNGALTQAERQELLTIAARSDIGRRLRP